MPTSHEHQLEQLKKRIVKFKDSYKLWKDDADDFRKNLEVELSRLMKQHNVVPAVLESRLKSSESASKNAEVLSIDDVLKLDDFVGLRLVFLLEDEVAKAEKLIRRTFDVTLIKNKADKLKVSEFGYRAIHVYGEYGEVGYANRPGRVAASFSLRFSFERYPSTTME